MSWDAWGDPPEFPCETCGLKYHSCICPECPVCGEFGNPACYEKHGLNETEEQIQSRIRHSEDNGLSHGWDDG